MVCDQSRKTWNTQGDCPCLIRDDSLCIEYMPLIAVMIASCIHHETGQISSLLFTATELLKGKLWSSFTNEE